MAELTDAMKVLRNDTGKRMADALETLAQNSEAPIGLGMTGATVGQVPVVKTVDANGVPTSYEPGAGGGGQEIEVSDTEPTNPSVDVWFQEQQQGTPVEVYTVPEINDMIAPAETSPTQAAHHVGEYIICVLNGQAKLYKVIAEISIDETLNPGQGGNIQAVSVGNMMTPVVAQLERGSVYSSIVKTPYTWNVFKIGAICFVSITFDTFSIPAVIGWKEIYTLPYTVSQDLRAVSSYIVTKKGKSTQIGLYQNVVRINNPETAIEEGDTISVVLPYITSDY